MELLRILYLILFFSLPLSLENFALGAGVIVPSEPLQIIISVVLLFNYKNLLKGLNRIPITPLLLFIDESASLWDRRGKPHLLEHPAEPGSIVKC